ncbi:MAG TPA: hypothetical protein VE959_25200 [Bryobacteraceae bacterium]|nr:hypothetical protein [Bryobacteraceae bacterium]
MFLHEEHQRIRIGGMEADRPQAIEEYEKLLAQHPDDPVYLYLAAAAQAARGHLAAGGGSVFVDRLDAAQAAISGCRNHHS